MKVLNESEIEKITCPGCKANIELERKQPTHRIIEHDQETPDIEELVKKEVEKLKPIDKPEEKPAKKEIELPSHVPGYRCSAGDNCTRVHKNKNHKARPKGKCNNCDQFSNATKGPCPWCEEGELEAIDEDELDDMKIRKPDVHGDDD